MSKIEKLLAKLNRKPIPNDITYDEVFRLAEYYGCEVADSGGKHPYKVIFQPLGKVIPIPVHGKEVKEIYIKKLKDLFREIEMNNEENGQ